MTVEDGFADGFNAVHDGTPVAPPPEQEQETAADPEVDASLLEEVSKDDDPVALPGYTQEQIAALLARTGEIDTIKGQLDKFSGHIGTLLQEVKGLKSPPTKPEAAQVEVDESEFAEAYPEFAAYLQQQLHKDRGSREQPELETLKSAYDQQLLEVKREVQAAKLTVAYPDWEDTVQDAGYREWLAKQSDDVQTVANTTVIASELGKVLGAYKAHSAKQATATKSKERLEAALTPTGVAGQRPPEHSEVDQFRAGWTAIAGRK